MAELLIYNGTDWRENLTPEEWTRLRSEDKHWDTKYANRWQKDHVVEIRDDGFWSAKGIYPRADKFRVVLLPGVPRDRVNHLLGNGKNGRKRFHVNSGALQPVVTIEKIGDLELTDTD